MRQKLRGEWLPLPHCLDRENEQQTSEVTEMINGVRLSAALRDSAWDVAFPPPRRHASPLGPPALILRAIAWCTRQMGQWPCMATIEFVSS